MAATMTRRIRPNEIWRERLGLSHHEACVLIAVISAFEVYGKPVMSTDVFRFLGEIGEIGSSKDLSFVAKRGWVKATGKVVCEHAYVPTPRGYSILGLKRPSRAA
jgi:hypothetical protein